MGRGPSVNCEAFDGLTILYPLLPPFYTLAHTLVFIQRSAAQRHECVSSKILTFGFQLLLECGARLEGLSDPLPMGKRGFKEATQVLSETSGHFPGFSGLV